MGKWKTWSTRKRSSSASWISAPPLKRAGVGQDDPPLRGAQKQASSQALHTISPLITRSRSWMPNDEDVVALDVDVLGVVDCARVRGGQTGLSPDDPHLARIGDVDNAPSHAAVADVSEPAFASIDDTEFVALVPAWCARLAWDPHVVVPENFEPADFAVTGLYRRRAIPVKTPRPRGRFAPASPLGKL